MSKKSNLKTILCLLKLKSKGLKGAFNAMLKDNTILYSYPTRSGVTFNTLNGENELESIKNELEIKDNVYYIVCTDTVFCKHYYFLLTQNLNRDFNDLYLKCYDYNATTNKGKYTNTYFQVENGALVSCN